jgi:hypothetical protein
MFFSFSWLDDMLCYKTQIDLQNKRRKSSQKKITGFQVLILNKHCVV